MRSQTLHPPELYLARYERRASQHRVSSGVSTLTWKELIKRTLAPARARAPVPHPLALGLVAALVATAVALVALAGNLDNQSVEVVAGDPLEAWNLINGSSLSVSGGQAAGVVNRNPPLAGIPSWRVESAAAPCRSMSHRPGGIVVEAVSHTAEVLLFGRRIGVFGRNRQPTPMPPENSPARFTHITPTSGWRHRRRPSHRDGRRPACRDLLQVGLAANLQLVAWFQRRCSTTMAPRQSMQLRHLLAHPNLSRSATRCQTAMHRARAP